jgi:hypothetical protein
MNLHHQNAIKDEAREILDHAVENIAQKQI